ncbi:hypothetical protein COV18_01280 [Candidatus Woesearchaeota archaeon CG10_big_fil_rev_8_21_14_0_10_37_12]|nr:MAG: hypothetical protein COV18_01280 [Candidatus Woesearchaeota archaeon CG10_big_fil_rev_8_21_14_0_10_37_12]
MDKRLLNEYPALYDCIASPTRPEDRKRWIAGEPYQPRKPLILGSTAEDTRRDLVRKANEGYSINMERT